MREIIGNTTATPYPRPDWNQTDATRADFIKNKPTVYTLEYKATYTETEKKAIIGILDQISADSGRYVIQINVEGTGSCAGSYLKAGITSMVIGLMCDSDGTLWAYKITATKNLLVTSAEVVQTATTLEDYATKNYVEEFVDALDTTIVDGKLYLTQDGEIISSGLTLPTSEGGGTADGGTPLSMPMIRFANACFGGNIISTVVSEENPLKLTVEIVGGGPLQVGDALQACVRKSYKYGIYNKDGECLGSRAKHKLRRFAQYTITEDDIGKRFLTLTLTARQGTSEEHALFHSGGQNQADNLSTIYLRIRRPKGALQDNTSGMTVDAEFSNIVTIWKRYCSEVKTVTIK